MSGSGRPLVKRILTVLLAMIDRLVPPSREVLLHSQPDLDDNVVALLRGALPELPVRVLVDDLAHAADRASRLGVTTPLVARRSWRGLVAYVRAAVTMTTHGLYGSPRRHRGRHVVGLWHGEFGKHVGHLAGEPHQHFDWMPVSSEASRNLRAAEFRLALSSIGVVGSPRQCLLTDPDPARRAGTSPAVVWAPTYRSTAVGHARVDGDPALVSAELTPDDPALLSILRRHGATLWYRPHPAEATPTAVDPSVVRLASDAELEQLGLTFYELLGGATCLLTDYSSLWVDWLLVDRPAISFCPDLDTYRRSRGLALEPHERWFPGPLARSKDEVFRALECALAGQDPDAARRAQVRGILHTAPDTDPVKAVWTHVKCTLE